MTLFDAHGRAIPAHGPDPDVEEAEILSALTTEMLTLEAEGEPMVVAFTAFSAFQIAGLVQLALRHPTVQASNREAAQRFIDSVREYFAESPAILQVLARGDDPTQDV